jgi:hypothetical protein
MLNYGSLQPLKIMRRKLYLFWHGKSSENIFNGEQKDVLRTIFIMLSLLQKKKEGQEWCHMAIIPAIREVEIGRIIVQRQYRQKVSELSSQQINPEW